MKQTLTEHESKAKFLELKDKFRVEFEGKFLHLRAAIGEPGDEVVCVWDGKFELCTIAERYYDIDLNLVFLVVKEHPNMPKPWWFFRVVDVHSP